MSENFDRVKVMAAYTKSTADMLFNLADVYTEIWHKYFAIGDECKSEYNRGVADSYRDIAKMLRGLFPGGEFLD